MNNQLKICVVELDNEGLLLVEFSDNDVLLLIDSIMLTGRVGSQYMYILVHINRYSFLNWAPSTQPDKTAKKMRKHDDKSTVSIYFNHPYNMFTHDGNHTVCYKALNVFSVAINVTQTTCLHKTFYSNMFHLPVKYSSNMHHARSKLLILHAQINQRYP